MLGLYKSTEVGKRTNHVFATVRDAAKAYHDGKIKETDVIAVQGSPTSGMEKTATPTHTTIGRLLIYNYAPEAVRNSRMLQDPTYRLDKKEIHRLLTDVARTDKYAFSEASDKLKNLGNQASTGLSVSLNDFLSETQHRDEVLKRIKPEELRIRKSNKSEEAKDNALVDLYMKAKDEIVSKARTKIEATDNRMYDWVRSGAKGNWEQFQQMVVAPLLVADNKGRVVPVPIDRSYSEGLDIGSYWNALHGARLGALNKTQETRKPGYMSKKLVNSMINQVVTDHDCGTTKGVMMSIDDNDALGRYTFRDVDLGSRTGKDKGLIPAGTLVIPEVLSRFKNNKIKEVPVRSVLKCTKADGVCAKCYGLDEHGQDMNLGVNVGVIAAHAMGEPATQMSMSAFHGGGLVGAKGTDAVSQFKRLEQLTELPDKLPNVATLARHDGKITQIDKDPVAGWHLHLNGEKHFVPGGRTLLVAKGSDVKKGDALSSGAKDPQEILELNGLGAVQGYLMSELYNLYKDKGPIRKKNLETFVRVMTNLGEVEDPGDHPELLPGDMHPISHLNSFNNNLKAGQKPVKFQPVLKGIKVLTREMQTDWLARMQGEKLKETVLEAAAGGWRSLLHHTNPIPGIAYGAEFDKGPGSPEWSY